MAAYRCDLRRKLAECFQPSLLQFAAGPSKKTVQTSTVWLLGGEIIRDLQETPKLRKKPVGELIDTLLDRTAP